MENFASRPARCVCHIPKQSLSIDVRIIYPTRKIVWAAEGRRAERRKDSDLFIYIYIYSERLQRFRAKSDEGHDIEGAYILYLYTAKSRMTEESLEATMCFGFAYCGRKLQAVGRWKIRCCSVEGDRENYIYTDVYKYPRSSWDRTRRIEMLLVIHVTCV